MIKFMLIEFKKNCNLKQVILYFFSIILLCILITFIENNMLSEKLGYKFNLMSFFEYNSTFLLCKLIFPIFTLYLSSLVFAADYSEGTLKYFLFSGITRIKLCLGKIIFLMISSIITIIIVFVGLGSTYLLFYGIDNSINYILKAFYSYMLLGIGCFPIILITVLMSIVFGQHIKTLFGSIGILIFSLCVDSVLGDKFYTPTGFISNANLYFSEISICQTYIIMLGVYVIILNIIILTLFKLKDIWS